MCFPFAVFSFVDFFFVPGRVEGGTWNQPTAIFLKPRFLHRHVYLFINDAWNIARFFQFYAQIIFLLQKFFCLIMSLIIESGSAF